jgi:hypothetical protein
MLHFIRPVGSSVVVWISPDAETRGGLVWSAQMVVGGVAVATALVLTFLQRPSPSSPAWVPLVFAATVAALPVGMLLHHTESQPPSGRMSPEEAAAYEEVRIARRPRFCPWPRRCARFSQPRITPWSMVPPLYCTMLRVQHWVFGIVMACWRR